MTEQTEHGYAMLLLGKLLEAHDIAITPHEDWFLNGKSLPAIRCLWFRSESNKSGQLDVQVLAAEDVLITESVAGVGQNEDALQDAFYNLASSSLYVLLAAFWGKIETDHLSIKQLMLGGKTYTAYIGNFGLRAADAEHPGVPDKLLAQLINGLDKASLSQDINWVSSFFCNTGQAENVVSSTLNNEPWDAGIDIINRAGWTTSASYYSARSFILLKRQPEDS